jgi:hypothetical protein
VSDEPSEALEREERIRRGREIQAELAGLRRTLKESQARVEAGDPREARQTLKKLHSRLDELFLEVIDFGGEFPPPEREDK